MAEGWPKDGRRMAVIEAGGYNLDFHYIIIQINALLFAVDSHDKLANSANNVENTHLHQINFGIPPIANKQSLRKINMTLHVHCLMLV